MSSRKAYKWFARTMLVFSALLFWLTGAVIASAATGDPLAVWQWKNPLPQGNQINGLAYGNNLFVAVGDTGTILTSADGASWTTVPITNIKTAAGVQVVPTDTKTGAYWLNLKEVTYGNGLFVAVGDAGATLSTILTSTDGSNWTLQADIKDATGKSLVKNLKSVVCGTGPTGPSNPNIFYGVGVGGTVLSSTNGTTWRSLAVSPTTQDLMAITYANNTFVGVGNGGTIITLLNNGNWRTITSGTATLNAVAAAADLFIAAGNNGIIKTSPDGITWTDRVSGVADNLNAVSHDGAATFVVAGSNGVVLRSTDGITWTTPASGSAVSLQASVHGVDLGGNEVFLAAGDNGTILLSADGTVWSAASSSQTANITGFAKGLAGYVATTDSGRIFTSPTAAVWTEVLPAPATVKLNGVAYNEGKGFAAVGDGGTYMQSYNGTLWSVPETISGNTTLNAVTWDSLGSRFVAVGDGGSVFTSADGLVWVQDSTQTATTNNLLALTLGDNALIAVGKGGSIIYSTYDATAGSWSAWKSAASGSTKDLLGVTMSHDAGGNVIYVAVGAVGTIVTTAPATPVDLSKWSAAKTIPANYKTANFAAVTADTGNFGTFAVVGDLGTILTSNDGSTWVERYPRATANLNAITYIDRQYLAGGDNGTLLASDLLDVSLHVTPSSYNFGFVPASQTSTPVTFTISNNGFNSVALQSVTLADGVGSHFELTEPSCGTPATIASGGTCTFTANLSHLAATATDTIIVTPATPVVAPISVPVTAYGGIYVFPSVSPGGTISSADGITPTTINGASAFPVQIVTTPSFLITPDSGYHIQEVWVNGASIGKVAKYTFDPISGLGQPYTIKAQFSNTPYTVSVATTPAGGGVVAPGTTTVNYGVTQSFSITPNIGWDVDTIKVDGLGVAATNLYSFLAVAANHTLDVAFKKLQNTVTTTVNTNGVTVATGGSITAGSITPAGACSSITAAAVTTYTCNYDAGVPFTIIPKNGYRLLDVIVDGSSLGAVNSYTLSPIREQHTIMAKFTNQWAITVSNDGNGKVSPTPTYNAATGTYQVPVTEGGSQTFTFTPNTGYVVRDVKFDGESIGNVASYTATNVTTNHTLDVTFWPKTFSITQSQTANGTVTDDTGGTAMVTANYGDTKIFKIQATAGFEILDVLVDGVSVGPVATYVFTNVTADHNISAVFRAEPVIMNLSIAGGAQIGSLDFSFTLPVGALAQKNPKTTAPLNEIDPATISVVGVAVASGATTINDASFDPTTRVVRIALANASGFSANGAFLKLRVFTPTAITTVAPFTINQATTPGGSAVAGVTLSDTYTQLPHTTALPAGGLYNTAQSVILSTTAGATIYYTLDNKTPTTSSAKYTSAKAISANTTLKYIGVDASGNQESVRQENYVFDKIAPTAVLFQTPALTTNSASASVIVGGTDIVSYKYQLDGVPTDITTATETPIATPIALTALLDGGHILNVIGKDSAGNWQDGKKPTGWSWTVKTTMPATTAAPAGGVYHADQAVTLTCTDATAKIYYTLDGTDPGINSLLYAAPIPIVKDTTIKFKAIDDAGNNEPIRTAAYTLLKLTITPLLTPTTITPTSVSGTVSSNPPPPAVNSTQVTVTITDKNGSAIATNLPAVIDTSAGTNMNKWSCDLSSVTLQDGMNTVVATATYGANTYSQAATAKFGVCNKGGDLSGNWSLGIEDVMSVLRIAIGLVPSSAAAVTCADVYPLDVSGNPVGDGGIDVRDALLLLRKVVTGAWQ
ncbi:MAG: hypothetical protein CXR30_09400 [Geobacter sp.]|nr:MAG: hypothetical protein CXR30_09400 [Geobacter sp.]